MNDLSMNHQNLKRLSSISRSRENLLIANGEEQQQSNHFLSSDRGLFASKDQQQQSPSTNGSDGGVARKLRQRAQENQQPGMKSDMKRYGTMEKLDVSDLVLTEGKLYLLK